MRIKLKNCDTCRHYSDPGTDYGSCGRADGGTCKHDKTWRSWESREEFKPLEPIKEPNYKIVKPFSVVDIFEKRPCHDQFLTLLKEPRRMGRKFSNFQDVKNSPTLMSNLSWLKEKGFISKKKEEWVNVYIDEKNKTCIGNFTYTSKKRAVADVAPDDDKRYVGSVLKS